MQERNITVVTLTHTCRNNEPIPHDNVQKPGTQISKISLIYAIFFE